MSTTWGSLVRKKTRQPHFKMSINKGPGQQGSSYKHRAEQCFKSCAYNLSGASPMRNAAWPLSLAEESWLAPGDDCCWLLRPAAGQKDNQNHLALLLLWKAAHLQGLCCSDCCPLLWAPGAFPAEQLCHQHCCCRGWGTNP